MSKAITSIVRAMPSLEHSGTVIFLHGSGDTGVGIKEWVKTVLKKDLIFPHLKILYPTAPVKPYTPFDGQKSYVWFDRLDIRPDVPEHLETVNLAVQQLTELVNSEVQRGIDMKNIIIGGFSMGGALALHLGYRSLQGVGGIFALSSFLNKDSVVYKELGSKANEGSLPPLFMCHGDEDELVPLEWGQDSFKNLKQYGVNGEFHVINNIQHELEESEIVMLREWILRIIPPKS